MCHQQLNPCLFAINLYIKCKAKLNMCTAVAGVELLTEKGEFNNTVKEI